MTKKHPSTGTRSIWTILTARTTFYYLSGLAKTKPAIRKTLLKNIVMRNSLLTIVIVLLLTAVYCSKDDTLPIDTSHDFAIYFLKDPNLKINDILTKALTDQDSTALDKVEIQNVPWLTNKDIDMYDFSSHLLYLKKDKSLIFPALINGLYPMTWCNKPFMVVAEKKKRYIGVFTCALYGDPWPVPEINDAYNFLFYPNDLLNISWNWYANSDLNDSRNDKIIKEGLINSNIFHAGIDVKLNKIVFIENSDTSTVEYTYTIKNNDSDNLYVLDPDKIGSDIFNNFNNGPSFLKSDEASTRNADLTELRPPKDTWNLDWFIRINSGDSITRTVNLRGYQHFPPGTYYCEMYFQSIKHIPKDQRVLSDGRYWIGSVPSPMYVFQY
jgi:hypothetical protein